MGGGSSVLHHNNVHSSETTSKHHFSVELMESQGCKLIIPKKFSLFINLESLDLINEDSNLLIVQCKKNKNIQFILYLF
jgi:hypothetical protein